MDIKKPARAGTMESNDIYIMITPNQGLGINIELESIAFKQFGNQIKKVILETLNDLDIKDAHIVAKDRGALDFTIKSRVETAVYRAL